MGSKHKNLVEEDSYWDRFDEWLEQENSGPYYTGHQLTVDDVLALMDEEEASATAPASQQ